MLDIGACRTHPVDAHTAWIEHETPFYTLTTSRGVSLGFGYFSTQIRKVARPVDRSTGWLCTKPTLAEYLTYLPLMLAHAISRAGARLLVP